MINIVIPMAGEGKRFVDKGITTPKPLIEISGKPFISFVLDSINFENANYHFLIRKNHYDDYDFDSIFKEKKIKYDITTVDKTTEGAVSTTLLCRDKIDSKNPLIVKDCDQILNWNISNFSSFVKRKRPDGVIVTLPTINPGFSFVKLDDDQSTVLETKEKQVISSFGNTGLYYFSKTEDYYKYSDIMIKKNIRVKNEFYVSQVFNEYILDLKKILHYPIPEIFSINTPEELSQNKLEIEKFVNS